MPPDYPLSTDNDFVPLNYVELVLCDLCLDGEGGECHAPGCALYMNSAPDLPIRDKVKDVRVLLTGPPRPRGRHHRPDRLDGPDCMGRPEG